MSNTSPNIGLGVHVSRKVCLTRNGMRVHMAPGPGGMATALIAARGNLVSPKSLLDGMWAEQEDGGPETAPEVLRQWVNRAREPLAALGLGIVSEYGRGYRIEELPCLPK